ncbi:hypothetical protein [Amycolatopsis dendrobii]|uniref:Uncharacterized protein n=1 Tax=Amycolatopsis dendrobii TaxID=2760662 RepID=A0A7W3VVT5_9PSEU|nr:hypothetical protein [Amycolatopsis dendrobii]MBB1153976.1 hypothetical protein [Amycolatopsis dendrobii]
MTDADTPRVPDQPCANTTVYDHDGIRVEAHPSFGAQVWTEISPGTWRQAFRTGQPPADAVKLGDVAKLTDSLRIANSACERRDAKLADIRAVLAGREKLIKNGVIYANELILIEMITAILDREPGREEPKPDPCKPCGEVGNCQRPHAADCIQKPVLYGLTVPDHIGTTHAGTYVRMHCEFCPRAEEFVRNPAEARPFIRRHAHGHVVEHQPDTEETDR